MRQLDIYHQAKHQVSKKDKNIRSFYVERAVQEVLSTSASRIFPVFGGPDVDAYDPYWRIIKHLDGDGSGVTAEMFARFPNTPGSSTPASPGIPHRRIRCKMCRYVILYQIDRFKPHYCSSQGASWRHGST